MLGDILSNNDTVKFLFWEQVMDKLRETLFKSVLDYEVSAAIYADDGGVLSGMEDALAKADEIGLEVTYSASDGSSILPGDMILEFRGRPESIVEAEDFLIGHISKYSGIASAARAFSHHAKKMKVVCGSWKKLPEGIRKSAKKAVLSGGAGIRMLEEPMVYLDKNYVEILGGIQQSLFAAASFPDRKKVIQVRGRYEHGDIVREAWTALSSGADVIFIDTGRIEDAEKVISALKPAIEKLQREENYREVKFAFAGGVKLEDLSKLNEIGVDIVGVGRAIVDAPLLDLHMEVTGKEQKSEYGHKYSLLDKSELLIENIDFLGTNLNKVASCVAKAIGLEDEDVLVIDVRDRVVALDILRQQIDPYLIVGKEKQILSGLAGIPGIRISEDTHISSRGMLGWIVGDEDDAELMKEQLDLACTDMQEVCNMIKKRALVLSSGKEVENGEIEDTNSPLILKVLKENGFEADFGGILKDDITLFCSGLSRGIEKGYGLIITTGGVGAEDKDFSVEAIQRLDPKAAAPYIAKFHKGTGRHCKDGIRIGVGRYDMATLVALPGPNDEVALCLDTLVAGIKSGWSKERLAIELAGVLRKRLKEKMAHSNHNC